MKKYSRKVVESSNERTLHEVLREGAKEALKQALQLEIDLFMEQYRGQLTTDGRHRMTLNGFHKEREIMTSAGMLSVKVPRVRDHEGEVRYQSSLIPPYLKRATDLDAFIPFLYLKGISTGDFGSVLSKLLRKEVAFSANSVVRLKEVWMKEYQEWAKQDLSKKEYVYWWADGVHFNVRLEDNRTCILVIMGVTSNGTKELVAIQDGFRESELSWREIMIDLKRRGLRQGPKLAIGDGALGFWAALRKEFPETREQRCWIHKMANVLNKLPKCVQPQAKRMLHNIYQADTRANAELAFKEFVHLYEAKYPKAVACILKSKNETMAFYDFPAEHWRHIRSTNAIESNFATVRLRTRKTKGCGSSAATLTMVFKLTQSAQKRWQRIHFFKLLPFVLKGIRFVDGIPTEKLEFAA